MAGLYLHVPFCNQRCTYCDFYFVTSTRLQKRYETALTREIELQAGLYPSASFSTIYLGGGTPSLLPAGTIYALLEQVGEHFVIEEGAEVTLELNPEDGDLDYLKAIKEAGVNRLSIGVQSFDTSVLKWMNRPHTAAESVSVLEHALTAGFENMTADLIFGVPGQSLDAWQNELLRMIALGIPHISAYSLTLEPRTPYWKQVEKGVTLPPEENLMADCFMVADELLGRHGFEHYEVSSYARPGCRSRHNSAYWKHHNYLGLGPSGHSFWWSDGVAHRWYNVRNLNKYIALLEQAAIQPVEKEALSTEQLADEYLLLRLRTSDGLDLDYFKEKYGPDLLDSRKEELDWLQKEGLVSVEDSCLRLTTSGLVVADTITQKLL